MQEIKKYLRSYIPALKYAQECLRDLDAITLLQSPKMDGMPRTQAPHGLESQIGQIDAIRRKAEKARERALAICEDIEDRLDRLEDINSKRLIRLRYIYGFTWAEVAEEMGYSERSIHRLHSKALEEMRRDDERLHDQMPGL